MTRTSNAAAQTVLTLAAGCAGAALFWAIGFPAYVLTGPAAAVSIVTLLGLPTHIPNLLRDAVFILIGLSIGSTVSPEVLTTALTWPISLLILTATLVAIVIAARAVLAKAFGYSRTTATLAAMPGHLSFVLALSTDLKADVPRVALVQTVRVLLLTLLVPVLIVLWGVEGTSRLADAGHIAPTLLLVLFPLAIALGLGFKHLQVPAPLLIGAMVVSAIGHGSDLTPGIMPPFLTVIAFICMGSLIGTRFRGFDRASLPGALLAGTVTTLIACAIAALGALAASALLGLPAAALLLAFAPGGVEIMAALAIETGLEPALVAAHHVFRLFALGLLIPLWIRR
ncbi:MAG: AbrB family transcriptional regulator [Rhodobacteraceae bacterium]|nr:AbrB family transcriptional regulator [Paracoccaceae bacterium]